VTNKSDVRHGSNRKELVIHREKTFDEDALPEHSAKLKNIVDYDENPERLETVLGSNTGRLDLDWTQTFCEKHNVQITDTIVNRLQIKALGMGYQIRVVQG